MIGVFRLQHLIACLFAVDSRFWFWVILRSTQWSAELHQKSLLYLLLHSVLQVFDLLLMMLFRKFEFFFLIQMHLNGFILFFYLIIEILNDVNWAMVMRSNVFIDHDFVLDFLFESIPFIHNNFHFFIFFILVMSFCMINTMEKFSKLF